MTDDTEGITASSPSGRFDVVDKIVVVTGGSRGIGYAIAMGFVKAGARVFICSRNAERSEQAVTELSQYGAVTGILADLSMAEGRRKLVDAVAADAPRVDVLINNAGTIWAEPIELYSDAGWSKVYDLNVKGTFFLIREFLPLLRAGATHGKPSRIINIGSVDAFHVPDYDTFAYSGSKAAVHQMSRHLAARLAPEGITVNVIAPGFFLSRMLEDTVAEVGEEAFVGQVPLGRFVTASDMAGAALFLASDAASFITGAILPVDGGLATTS